MHAVRLHLVLTCSSTRRGGCSLEVTMGCIEHECRECGHAWFDNWPTGSCPRCGGEARHWYDEPEDDR